MELSVELLPEARGSSPGSSPRGPRSPAPSPVLASRRNPFRRAATYSSLVQAELVQARVLRRPTRVRRIDGEQPGLLESQLGPHATEATWAVLNRRRVWWRRLVHPNSQFRRAWDALTSVVVVLSVAQVPLQAVLSWWPYVQLGATGFALFSLVMRVWFLAELVLNLRTGYITKGGTLVMDERKIFRKHVLSGWLLLDFLGVMPVEHLLAPFAALLPKPAGMVQKLNWRDRLMTRLSLVADQLGRVGMRVARGKFGRADPQSSKFAWSALSYRCERGTVDTLLSYCVWHETSYEMVVNVWRLSRDLQVTRLLKRAQRAGLFWQSLHFLLKLGMWADRATKVLFLTKWGQLRRLLTLTQFWRIGIRWLRVRRIKAGESLQGMRNILSHTDLAGMLARTISRHTGLDQLQSGLETGGLGSRMTRVVSRHAGLGKLGGAIKSLGLQTASVPARLSELGRARGSLSLFGAEETTRAAQLRAGGASVREWESVRQHDSFENAHAEPRAGSWDDLASDLDLEDEAPRMSSSDSEQSALGS
ncbi:hypothetical protein T492DRAFT_1037181 [Pavlovales sp. CCMP2436]|nr:hypothetical protein T492DRAFT_1037181 [Pavlovales sp. CCMP2436]